MEERVTTKRLLNIFWDKTFAKFVVVGVINTVFGTSIMFAAYNVLHLGYWTSSAANYILGSILSYFLNKYYTFRYRKNDFASVIKFVVTIASCYLVAYAVAKPLINLLLSGFGKTFRENVAMVLGMCLFVALNYLGQRFFAFKKDDK